MGTTAGLADRPFGILSALSVPPRRREHAATPAQGGVQPALLAAPVRLVLADRDVEAKVEHHGAIIHLEIAGHGLFRISEREIRVWRRGEVLPPWNQVELALAGPALILAMALRGDFCWHASAVALEGAGVFVFLGDSGAGKSTLAARLANGTPGWSRVSDDLALIRCQPDGPGARVLPCFPQPKLPLEAGRRVLSLPKQIPLAAVFVLEKAEGDELATSTLGGSAAVASLIEHSVATRLFGPETMARHLDSCSRLASEVRCFRLQYPHRPDVIEEVRRLLVGLTPSSRG